MPKIRCQEHDCKYNNKSYCMKDGIYIKENSSCESFKKGMLDKRFAFEFATFEDDEKGILCQAKKCIHNKDCKCKATCICISCKEATCRDYKSKKE